MVFDLEKMLFEVWSEDELNKLVPDNIDATPRRARVTASGSSRLDGE